MSTNQPLPERDRGAALAVGGQATLLTPGGRGGVATLRIDAEPRHIDRTGLLRLASGGHLADQPTGRVLFAHWGNSETEEVVLCRVTERVTELHCHGGRAAIERVLSDLERRGIRRSDSTQPLPGESWLDAECRIAVSEAMTLRCAAILLRQQQGLLRETLQRVIDEPDADAAHARLTRLLEWSEFGRHLTRPWSVVLAGRPNVGKSSLMNALLGYSRSITYDQPGTTRDVITGLTALDGWPIELTDTAGLRVTDDPLEADGVLAARRRLVNADLTLHLLDLSEPPEPEDERLMSEWPDAIQVAHKCDLPAAWTPHPRQIRVSSRTGEGIGALVEQMTRRLVPALPADDQPVPVRDRLPERLAVCRQLFANRQIDAARRCLEELLVPRESPPAS